MWKADAEILVRDNITSHNSIACFTIRKKIKLKADRGEVSSLLKWTIQQNKPNPIK